MSQKDLFMWFPHKKFNYYLEIDEKFLYNLYGSLESLENEYTMIDIQKIFEEKK